MSYVCDIKHKDMIKAENFDEELQILSYYAKVLSHPARLMILKFLAEKNVCMSGDISNEIPLSRTTVSQHLKELKNAGLISGSIDGLKVNYCINHKKLVEIRDAIGSFFGGIDINNCC